MPRLIGVVWIAALLVPSASAQKDLFSKYKAVEAYEIRPGILMIPRYADDGKVCEIGLQPLRYTPDGVLVIPSLSRQTIDQIVDELAPEAERNPIPRILGKADIMYGGDSFLYAGNTVETQVNYEDVSVDMIGRDVSHPTEYVAAVILWTKRHCR